MTRGATFGSGSLGKHFPTPRDKVSITVDDLSPVIDSAAQTGSLTHVEHGVFQTMSQRRKKGSFLEPLDVEHHVVGILFKWLMTKLLPLRYGKLFL